MNKKLLVREELLRIFSQKYPNHVKVIENEISEFLANKARLTVRDLDLLEENIRKLCCFKKEARPVLATLDKSIDFSSEKLEDKSKTSASPYLVSPLKKSGIRIVERSKDRPLFPSDSFTQDSSSFSFDKRKIRENDDWGKIIHADHLRFLSEEKLQKTEKKNKQVLYRNYLLSQIAEKSPVKELNENKETLEKTQKKPENLPEWPKKHRKEKEWLDEIVQRRKDETESKLQNKLKEQKEMKELWAKQEEEELYRQKKLRRIRENVAKEQQIQATARKRCKYLLQEYEKSHSRSLIEENIRKIKENEQKKIEFINKRLQFVHDDERLKKLVKAIQLPHNPSPSSLSPSRSSPSDLQTPSFLSRLQGSESPKVKNFRYLSELKEQIEEKKKRDQDYQRIQREQGQIWAEQDLKALADEFSKHLQRKHTQKELRDEYSSRIAMKLEKKQKELLLSPSEAGMNRKLFESSLALLDS